ncbi:hypothetical protein Gpo141_00011564 [Globisporangium polare]
MDAFVVRKRRSPQEPLFEKDAFLFFPSSPSPSLEDSQELKELVATNGGRLLASDAKGDGARVIVVLHQTIEELQSRDVEMIARFVRKGAASALVVRSQWVRDCVHQQQRLATHSYDQTRVVLALTTTSETGDQHAITAPDSVSSDEGNKKRKIDVNASSTPQATVVSGELLRPHLRPWKEVNDGSLLILDARAKEQQETSMASNAARKVKIAGFDMDGTWIETKSGKRFAVDVNDWKWFHPTHVRAKLDELVRNGYEIVLFSNQNGIAKGNVTAKEIEGKVQAIITKLNLPVLAILATKSDLMRKPRLGGWQEMLKVLGIDASQVNMDESFYCGDAAGRPKISGRSKDFAATDYKFAVNLGIKFHTPEDLFLKSMHRIHTLVDMWEIGFDPRMLCSASSSSGFLTPASADLAKSTQEVVIMVGPPASGKSFFTKTHFSSYTTINQDELKTVANCKKKCLEALAQKKSVIVDSTNRDSRSRSEWIAIAKQQNVPIRCFEMDIEKPLSMHLNTFRSLTEDKKIPDIAIHTFYKNLVPPQATEGFAEIVKVRFRVQRDQLSEDKLKLLCSFL